MAKDQFSFDIVSEVSMPEVTNAVDRSSTEDRLKAAVDVLKDKAVKRGISLKALSEGEVHPAAKGTFRQSVHVNTGISEDRAKAIVKLVKGSGLKVQSQIQGEQVRITGKKKDDLQAVIAAVKEEDFGIPLQFTNFRP